MLKGRFRGKFVMFYNWLNLCPDTCSVCTLCVNGKCCNFYILVPGKRFYLR